MLFHVVESTHQPRTVTVEVYVVTAECDSIFHHFPIAACFIVYKCRQFSVLGFTKGSLGSVRSATELGPLGVFNKMRYHDTRCNTYSPTVVLRARLDKCVHGFTPINGYIRLLRFPSDSGARNYGAGRVQTAG